MGRIVPGGLPAGGGLSKRDASSLLPSGEGAPAETDEGCVTEFLEGPAGALGPGGRRINAARAAARPEPCPVDGGKGGESKVGGGRKWDSLICFRQNQKIGLRDYRKRAIKERLS